MKLFNLPIWKLIYIKDGTYLNLHDSTLKCVALDKLGPDDVDVCTGALAEGAGGAFFNCGQTGWLWGWYWTVLPAPTRVTCTYTYNKIKKKHKGLLFNIYSIQFPNRFSILSHVAQQDIILHYGSKKMKILKFLITHPLIWVQK